MGELLDISRVLEMLRPHGFTPLQRVLLAWTGTLQSTLSAYFGRHIRVRVLSQRNHDGVIHRVSQLYGGTKVVCQADSYLHITRQDLRRRVLEGEMGIGQALETLDIRPSFMLLDVGQEETCFWRTYHLEDPGVHCQIREVFPRALYVEEETLRTTFHEVINNAAWDQLWSWLLEEDGNVSELRNRRLPHCGLASAGE